MTGLDCNILVQLALADHPAHAATVVAVQNEVQRDDALVFPSLVVTEFLHVVTDARRFDPPLTMIEALDWMEEILANPAFKLLELCPESLRQTFRWMRQFSLGRNASSTPTLPLSCTLPERAACSPPIRATSRCLVFSKWSCHESARHASADDGVRAENLA